jgi:coproporphyrinogen III oxidase
MQTSAVREYLLDLQQRIVAKFEALDGKPFSRDEWKRPEGGGGISRILEDGNLL